MDCNNDITKPEKKRIRKTIDPNNIKTVHEACEANNLDALRILLDRSNNTNINEIDEFGDSLLHNLIENEYAEGSLIFKEVLDRGANIELRNLSGKTPLFSACGEDQLATVKALFSRGACIDSVDRNGDTPLHEASKDGSIEIVTFILDRKAEIIDAKNKFGQTPLHCACKFLQLETIKFLLNRGAKMDEKDNNGETVLHFVICKKPDDEMLDVHIMEELIKHGADINIGTGAGNAYRQNGMTPLHLACYCQRLDLVKLLLNLGANVNARDDFNRTTLYRCNQQLENKGTSKTLLDIINYLQSCGGTV